MNLDETIVAISSPPGAAVRGIVRLSGPDALPVAASVFQTDGPIDLPQTARNCVVDGRVVLDDAGLPATAYVFRRPNSYTRQDMAEIHTLGAPGVLAMLVEACIAAGARRAGPGEFTARAFFAGAMDLSQVHAVAGMIAARSDEQVRAAERLLHGALSQTAKTAREQLADTLSLVEGAMDFADEPIEFITPDALCARLADVRDSLRSTVAAGLRAERWGALPRVLLAGAPNAGKSSLMNRLTGLNRAICAPLAGTTRDILAAPLNLGPFECLLIDLAGFEVATDTLNAQAQRQAATALQQADLILHVVDAATPTPAPLPAADAPRILLANKWDAIPADRRRDLLRRLTDRFGTAFCVVSAATGEGCDGLKQRIAAELDQRPADIRDGAIALMAEHRAALAAAIEAVEQALTIARDAGDHLDTADLVAAELRIAADALAALVGRDQTEDMLGRIFARFCVGK